jgi:hypothetical protein
MKKAALENPKLHEFYYDHIISYLNPRNAYQNTTTNQ